MAKYDIIHSCGHEETVQIYGTNTHGERENKKAWLESIPCRECAKAAKSASMVQLDGSDKQVAWAMDIRLKVIGSVHDLEAKENIDLTREIENIKSNITSAKWFIDHRDDDPVDLINYRVDVADIGGWKVHKYPIRGRYFMNNPSMYTYEFTTLDKAIDAARRWNDDEAYEESLTGVYQYGIN